VIMPFGKHKGCDLEDLPDAYVDWLHALSDLRDPLRSAIEREWQIRFGQPEPARRGALALEARTVAEDIIRSGYRVLAKRHHPDVGAADGHMTLVNLNHAVAWLRQAVRMS
jgi:hypothetical protein